MTAYQDLITVSTYSRNRTFSKSIGNGLISIREAITKKEKKKKIKKKIKALLFPPPLKEDVLA